MEETRNICLGWTGKCLEGRGVEVIRLIVTFIGLLAFFSRKNFVWPEGELLDKPGTIPSKEGEASLIPFFDRETPRLRAD